MMNDRREFMDKALLCVYAFLALMGPARGGLGPGFVICMLAATAASFGAALPERPFWTALISAAYFIFCCFMPCGIYFIPMAAHGLCRRRLRPVIAAAVPALAIQGSLAGIAFVAVGTAFAVLLAERHERLELREEELRSSRDDWSEHSMDLERQNKELRDAQDAGLYAATLRERNRIAREIHDNVGHVLSRGIIMAGALETMNRDRRLSPMLGELEQSLSQAMDSVRASVHDLHDDSIDLKTAAEKMIGDQAAGRRAPDARETDAQETDAQAAGPAIYLDYDMSRLVPNDVKYCFLTVLKEALHNAAEHSGAEHVKVTMREHPAIWQLVIQDDGRGASAADIEGGRGAGKGIGLENMRERVSSLGGSIQVTGDRGFRIFITIPKGSDSCSFVPEKDGDGERT